MGIFELTGSYLNSLSGQPVLYWLMVVFFVCIAIYCICMLAMFGIVTYNHMEKSGDDLLTSISFTLKHGVDSLEG